MKNKKQVIAIFDVGKTNKKLFLFDQSYEIVYERTARFIETTDEDGFPCENLENLRLSVFDALRLILGKKEFDLKAVNFSAYGASFVYVDEEGNALTPLYNYLKPYPKTLQQKFYAKYGGEEAFSLCTASPLLGSLNSGLQLYRIKEEQQQVFARIKYALHLPQYLSYLISGKAQTDITSIGCHTALWDFQKQSYHQWVTEEGLIEKFAPVTPAEATTRAVFPGTNYLVGTGLHDSSAALLPYLISFTEPFILLSTGTWCISLNPFNDSPLTAEELKQDCLCYLQYQGRPVKAARLFAGQIHEEGIKRIAAHFNHDAIKYRTIAYHPALITSLEKNEHQPFESRDLSIFNDDAEAYHQLMIDIIKAQIQSTQLVLTNAPAKRLFVDGGFSNNAVYMNLLAAAFPQLEVYAASMTQATALGAALAIHKSWNKESLPATMIKLQYYAVPETFAESIS